MWLDTNRLEAVDTALNGSTSEVDRVLADILGHAPSQRNTPNICLTCGRDLLRRPLPRPDLYVSACPDGHGGWMTDDVADALRAFVERETGQIARKRHTIAVLNRALMLGAFAVTVALAWSYAIVNGIVPAPVATIGTPTTLSREEWVYFQQAIQLLEEGTSNRLRLEADLGAAPNTYAARLDTYRTRQLELRGRLAALETPSRARRFHEKLLVATDQQIQFYEALVAAKLADPTVTPRHLKTHPFAQATDKSLWAAWHLILETYPGLDSKMGQTIEQHLCAYDVIGNS